MGVSSSSSMSSSSVVAVPEAWELVGDLLDIVPHVEASSQEMRVDVAWISTHVDLETPPLQWELSVKQRNALMNIITAH